MYSDSFYLPLIKLKKRGLAMTEALYFLDCYLKEFEAIVEKVTDERFVVLDRTAFYPEVDAKAAPFTEVFFEKSKG
jgi:hypothetical protein